MGQYDQKDCLEKKKPKKNPKRSHTALEMWISMFMLLDYHKVRHTEFRLTNNLADPSWFDQIEHPSCITEFRLHA